jgi:putative intracellular protease/amidase
MTRNVAILIFDDVEVLDFCGPLEVFGVTGQRDDGMPILLLPGTNRSWHALA